MKTALRAAFLVATAGYFAACGADAPPTPPALPGALAAPRFTARTAARPPPPIAGGTLLALRGGDLVAASDPDHDAVWLADLRGAAPTRRVALRVGDEPGRLAQDDAGRVHVVLRGAGAVATVDPASAVVTARRDVRPVPRGITWDAAASALYVVCAGGEFVTLPAEGAVTATIRAPDDLRDVVMLGGAPVVSTFRAASLHRVALAEGGTRAVTTLRASVNTAALAWRVAPVAGGGLITLSQSVGSRTLGVFSGAGYYGAVSFAVPMTPRVQFTLATGEAGLDARIPDGGLAVDVAAAFDGASLRVALASPGWSFGQGVAPVREWILAHGDAWEVLGAERLPRTFHTRGQPVAVTYTERRELVVQTRAPGRIVTPTREVVLYDDEVADEGHDIFHASTASGLACASCHPEGGDDGQVWNFLSIGGRRTPLPLRGGILRTAPFHWDGDLRDMSALCDLVFTTRMGGDPLRPAQAQRLGRWLDGLAAPRAPALDREAVARGEALFRSAETACATCHAGPMLTDNRAYDVGTGQPFQVPPLVGLAYRAPYMHNGCAPTLAARFTSRACGGGDRHGRTSQLTPAQRGDLVAFLASR